MHFLFDFFFLLGLYMSKEYKSLHGLILLLSMIPMPDRNVMAKNLCGFAIKKGTAYSRCDGGGGQYLSCPWKAVG